MNKNIIDEVNLNCKHCNTVFNMKRELYLTRIRSSIRVFHCSTECYINSFHQEKPTNCYKCGATLKDDILLNTGGKFETACFSCRREKEAKIKKKRDEAKREFIKKWNDVFFK